MKRTEFIKEYLKLSFLNRVWIVIIAACYALVVWPLWNLILPELFGFHSISYIQTLGLLLICRELAFFAFAIKSKED